MTEATRNYTKYNNTTSRCMFLSQNGWNTVLVCQFVLQHWALMFANRQQHFHHFCHTAGLSLFSVLTSTKHTIMQNPISFEALQSYRALLPCQYSIRRAFHISALLNNIRLCSNYDDGRMGHSANHSILALCIAADLFGTSYRAYL